MKTPPWDDGRLTPNFRAEYGRLDVDQRAYCDTLAAYSVAAAKAYLCGRMEMREELTQARDSARLAILRAIDAGERRERGGGAPCP